MSQTPGWKAFVAAVFVVAMVLWPVASVAAAAPSTVGSNSANAPDRSPASTTSPGVSSNAGVSSTADRSSSSPSASDPSASSDTAPRHASRAGSVDPSKLSAAVKLQISRAQANENESGVATERVPVIVVLRQQPDEALDLRSLSAQAARRTMKQFARERQAPLLNYLEEQRQKGRAEDIQPFWIRNTIAVEASPQTIMDLTRSSRVEEIIYDQRVSLLSDSSNSTIARLLDRLRKYGNVSTRPQGFERVSTGDRAWSVEFTGADDVQERGVTGEGVNVSIVDTGIDANHPALEGQVVKWKDFTDGNCSNPCDPNGHGTHVAGTVAGQPDAEFAVGVAPGANLFGARVLGEFGGGRLSDVLAGFEWSANNSADVVSASLGLSPLIDSRFGTRSAVRPGNSSTPEFRINGSASSFPGAENLSVSLQGFKPAYVFVTVVPTYENGTYIDGDSENQTQVMRNLSVALENPNGTRSLERFEADWVYSGEVPDSIGFWKFKPSTSRTLAAGNWTLNVTNNHPTNISYQFQTLSVYPTNGSDEMSRFVNNLATSQDVIPVIAAGNSGLLGNRSLASPGAAEKAITVGATGYQTNDVASFSSRGPVGYGSETRPGVDLIAPGVDVLSTVPLHYTASGEYEDAYAYFSGTSMATPHVSGAVALLLDANPNLNRTQVLKKLRSSAQDVPYGENAVGAGALDVWAAVNSTIDLTARMPQSEAGVQELFAGLGETAGTSVSKEVGFLHDGEGDAGNAPDIRLTHPRVTDEFEILTYNNTRKNATFDIYIDADANDTTGDSGQYGADYKVHLNRTYHPSVPDYSVAVSTFEFNASSGNYEPTSDLGSPYVGSVSGALVEVWDIQVAGRSDSEPIEFHVISSTPGTTDIDSIPDTGQARQPVKVNISGVAVAWNATAGEPMVNAPITFTLYNSSGVIVGNKTVRTDQTGKATAKFNATTITGAEYTIEITDTNGNEVRQFYSIGFDDPEGLVDSEEQTQTGGYQTDAPDYRIRQNTTLQINIPIYNVTQSGGIADFSPYQGNASLRIYNYRDEDSLTLNDLTIEDGVLRTTVDFANRTIEDVGNDLDLTVALNSSFSSASQYLHGGEIDLITGNGTVQTTLSPDGKIAEVGQNATFSFQTVRRLTGAESEPMNTSVTYEVTWIKDRQVAALFEDLPESTVKRIKKARRTVANSPNARLELTDRDRRQIREAYRNLSETQGISINVTRGAADPTARGIGTLNVTPPEDTRFGFVYAWANATDASLTEGFSFVYIDDRLEEFQRKQTQPDEDTRYSLDVGGFWGSHEKNGMSVPADNITVQVALYDEKTESLVDNATVTLYGTSGDMKTITTSGSGYVEVNITAPDVDWLNSSYYQRQQQVLGIAHGYQTAEGRAVADIEDFYGFVEEEEANPIVENVVNAIPELSWNNGTLRLDISYDNESGDPVSANANGTRTLVEVKTPDTWSTSRDVNVSFIAPMTQDSTVSYNFSEPVPSSQPRRYAVETRTASMDWSYWDGVYVSGPRVSVQAPDTFIGGTSETVTVTVTDRNGDPIPNAVVVWSYNDYIYDSSSRSSRVGGDTFIARTDSTGTATFTVDVPKRNLDPDEFRSLDYRVGIATKNFSNSFMASGFADVINVQLVNVTGRILENSSDPAAGDVVRVKEPAGKAVDVNITDSDGDFSLEAQNNSRFDLVYGQLDESKDGFTIAERDGSVDLWPIDRFETAGDTDFGTITLPEGHVVNVTVLDESGDPVEDARIKLYIENTATGADMTTPWMHTRQDGMMYPHNNSMPGFELRDNVTVTVKPPEDGDRFVDATYVRDLQVTGPRNVTITLEDRFTTVSGRLFENDSDPAVNDTVAVSKELRGGFLPPAMTNETGHFTADILEDTEHDLQYYQAHPRSFEGVPGEAPENATEYARDGSVDMYALARVNTSTPVDLGDVTLPEGHVVNVTVVDESGAPVENASVTFRHRSPTGPADAGIVFPNGTNADGMFEVDDPAVPPGFELTGNVSVIVSPPANDSSFVQQTYSRDLTVTNDTNVTITLAENVTASGDLIAEPQSGYANYTRVNLTLTNVTPAGVSDDIASYRWDFGDGTSDVTSANNTTHVFVEPGNHTVTVTALDENESAIFSATTTVNISRAEGDLIAEPKSGVAGQTTVKFTLTNVTEGVDPAMYDWDFGDGTSDVTSANNTTHVFVEPGNHTVTVRALNEFEQPVFTATTTVTIEGPDVSVEVTAPSEQRLQNGVVAQVNVTNELDEPVENVTVRLNASGAYWSRTDERTTRTWTVDLNGSETKTLHADITDWAIQDLSPQWYSQGRIQLLAQADPGDEFAETNEANNRAVTQTVATFSDLDTATYTQYTGVVNETKEITVWVDNDGSTATPEGKNYTVLVEFGDGTSTTFNVSDLGRFDSVRKTLTHNYTQTGTYRINTTVLGDTLDPYTGNNRSTDRTRIEEFEFDVNYVSSPYRVEKGSQFQVWVSYDTNVPTDVNLTLDLPSEGLELAENVDQNLTKIDRSSSWGGWVSWTVNATSVAHSGTHSISVSATARDESDSGSDTIQVIVPKIQVSDQAVIRLGNGTDNGTATLTVRNETTFDHELTLSIQAGAEGRTLQGLQYLFDYPYGCVEQTTSPMLAALSTDQYYRHENRTPGPNYDRDETNKSIAIGMERLSTGDNAQHDNGSWSMWGDDPEGDLFYTMYAYFGVTSVRNDPVQSNNTLANVQDIPTSLAAIDFNETIDWIRGQQQSDGSIRSDGYFLDNEAAMTGFALLTIDQAEAGGLNSTALATADAIRTNASRYLVNQQAADGSWADGHTKTTAIVVWGLQTVKESDDIQNETLLDQINASIENGTAWLLDQQKDNGGFPYEQNPYWSDNQRSSSATAWTLLALNETGIPAHNASLKNGTKFLINVYDEDGSFGGTESTGMAIRALNELGQGIAAVDRTVTVTIHDDDGTITETVEVNATTDIVEISLDDSELAMLRDGSLTKRINVTSTGDGVAIVALNNRQVVNRNEYEETQRQLGLIQTASLEGGLSALANGEESNGQFSVSLDVPSDFSTGGNQTLNVTVTNNNETATLLNPIIEIPLTSAFNESRPLTATVTVNGTEKTRDIEVQNSTLTDGKAIFVFGREVPAGESRTYHVNISVPSPGDVTIVSDVRPLYNESLNVNASGTFTAEGVGTMNVEVVYGNGTRVSDATIDVGGSQTAANAVSRELSQGTYEITASTPSRTFPSVNVSLSAFETANVTFVVPPSSLADPAVIARTSDGITVPSGTIGRTTLQAANATTKEVVRLAFNVTTPLGTNNTAVVAVNESVERAFRVNDDRIVTVRSAGPTAEVLADNVGRNGDETTLKLRGDGEMAVNITYVGYKLGDVTQDDNVTTADARTIAENLAEGVSTNEYGDVSEDGQVTVVDAMMIAQYASDNRDAGYGGVTAGFVGTTPTISLRTSDSLAQDGPFSSTLVAENVDEVTNIGAFKLRLTYDPKTVSPENVTVSASNATNFTVAASSPEPGVLLVVGYTDEVDTPNGTVELASLSINGTRTVTSTNLSVEVETITDTDGNTLVDSTDASDLGFTTCVADVIAGSDGTIGFTEILTAINYYAENTEVPDTGGKTIGFREILRLINAYAENEAVAC